eukprot:CAMPEP_0194516236 /NCGR_PEP_ID=MMETSP0253-20130528/49082_1 /TAXON_ID=2966 /ORGANISM="Noctiluca scintillans" /LENGTH=222 /DNA_ID=CAMNT_0039360067 /DNA_START=266 /DNA_END=932 /DNA_ORIENTATION=+
MFWISGKLITQSIELHMALNFLATFSRWKGVAFCLQRTLFLTWLCGFVPSAIIAVTIPYDIGGATPCYPRGHIFVWLVLGDTALFLTCMVYLWACWRAFWYPCGVWRRAIYMVFWYPVSYCLCFGPLDFVVSWDSGGFDVAKLFFGMNGFANALVYSCNSKYVCDESDKKSGCAENDSDAWSGLASFHAGFDKRVEVVEFSQRPDVSFGGPSRETRLEWSDV